MPPVTRLEVNLSAYQENLSFLRTFIGPNVKLCLCLKAGGYGHGLTPLAQAALPYADSFSIARVEEGIQLREAGIQRPILLLAPHTSAEVEDIAHYQLEPLIGDRSLLAAYGDASHPIKVHLKVDTGMGRLGCFPAEAPALAEAAGSYPNIKVEGVCTHFADAEEDPEGTAQQIALFNEACSLLERARRLPSLRHCCNSAGTLHHPEAHYDMVRAGSGPLGYVLDDYPHPKFPQLRFCSSLKSVVATVRTVPAGTRISYGSTFTAPQKMTLGIIPMGYADGLPLSLSKGGKLLVDGKEAPVVGKVCMDQCIVDVSHIPHAQGKEVLAFGDHPTQNLAALVKDIPSVTVSTVFTTLPPRVPRIYIY